MGEKRVGDLCAAALRYEVVSFAQFQRTSCDAVRVSRYEMNALFVQPIQHNFCGVFSEAAEQRLRGDLYVTSLTQPTP